MSASPPSNERCTARAILCLGFFMSFVLFTAQADASPSVTAKTVKNYRYELLLEKRQAPLKDGFFQTGKTPDDFLTVRLISYSLGRLNADRLNDAAVVLAASPMGSGSFFELTVLYTEPSDRTIRQSNSIVLGDRIKIRTLRIQSGKIRVEYDAHGPDDPSCCPKTRTLRTFHLINGQLTDTDL
jgi:hypothetical protein